MFSAGLLPFSSLSSTFRSLQSVIDRSEERLPSRAPWRLPDSRLVWLSFGFPISRLTSYLQQYLAASSSALELDSRFEEARCWTARRSPPCSSARVVTF